MYCEVKTRTHWPGVHSMSFWNGSKVVSVWKTLSSTCPLRIAECRSLIGNSGLVTDVEWVNGAATKSRRALSGASGRSPRPAASSCACDGCGIAVETLGWHPRPDVTALGSDAAAHVVAMARSRNDAADAAILSLRMTSSLECSCRLAPDARSR